MFERFTEKARRVVILAQEESRELGHDHIGTEHLLLALVREQEGIAGQALGEAGITLDETRRKVEELVGRGEPEPKRRSGKRWRRHVPFTPRAKKTMELALREALGLGHNYIGTEHLLLGMLSLGEGRGSETLAQLDADPAQLRESLLKLTRAHADSPRIEFREVEFEMREGEPSEPSSPRCPRCDAELSETAAVQTMDLPRPEGEGTRSVTFAFCRRCGSSLGALGS
jgi:ATP-dependent Clp protease ATP-binding subunit ClpA